MKNKHNEYEQIATSKNNADTSEAKSLDEKEKIFLEKQQKHPWVRYLLVCSFIGIIIGFNVCFLLPAQNHLAPVIVGIFEFLLLLFFGKLFKIPFVDDLFDKILSAFNR